MGSEMRECIVGAIVGQAVGDALGAPTEGMTRAEIAASHGRVVDFLTAGQAGTDDSEYAALTAQLLLERGHEISEADVSRHWSDLLVDQVGGFDGGGFSEMVAIHNLERGLTAPVTGSDNHEMWSDGSAMRVAPIGAFCAGDPQEAARIAGIDAAVSHSRDGIWCGQAVAAGVAVAVVSDDWREVVDATVAAVPEDSWSRRMFDRALAIATSSATADERYDELERSISIWHYPWSDVAPEAVALALGVFAIAEGDYVSAVLGGVNIGRDADTIAAMAGGMAGGLNGVGVIPEAWREQVRELKGSCIAATAGVSLVDLGERIADIVESRITEAGR